LRTSEEGQRIAERRGQRARGPVEDRAPTATGYRGYVEGLGAPCGAAGERRVALKVDGEEASGPVMVEAGERVRVCIRIGLCQWTAVKVGAQLMEGVDGPSTSSVS